MASSRLTKWFQVFILAGVALGIGAGGFFGYRSFVRERRRAHCQNNLKLLAFALHNYASNHNDRFPPAFVRGKDGKPWHPTSFDPGTSRVKATPISMSLNVDGRQLAQSISEQLENLYEHATGAPFRGRMKQWYQSASGVWYPVR